MRLAMPFDTKIVVIGDADKQQPFDIGGIHVWMPMFIRLLTELYNSQTENIACTDWFSAGRIDSVQPRKMNSETLTKQTRK